LRGDLGTSLTTHEPVMTEFLTLFPATIELALFAMVLSILIGLPAGVLAAVKRNTVADYAVMGVSLTGYSMPIFWWALLLILFFSVQLGWTPVSGRIAVQFDVAMDSGFMLLDTARAGDWPAFRSAMSHLVLPAIALGTIPLAVIARMTRSSMLEVLREDYVRTARAKGLPYWEVILVHALRNALIPVITVIGLQVGLLLSGAILTETIFSWPGVGNWLIHGVQSRDYPVVQGGILLVAAIVISVNLIVDLLYGVVNPRIRHG
jgi:dipeptide transport system permease protein